MQDVIIIVTHDWLLLGSEFCSFHNVFQEIKNANAFIHITRACCVGAKASTLIHTYFTGACCDIQHFRAVFLADRA
jgi:hypothetical protein